MISLFQIIANYSQKIDSWLLLNKKIVKRVGGGSSGCSRWGLKESSLPEIAHDERNWHQRDANASWSKELMNGVGQDERARSRCHFGANHCLAEAQLAEHACHVDPTGKTDRKVVRSTCEARNWLLILILLTTAQSFVCSVFQVSVTSVYHNTSDTSEN